MWGAPGLWHLFSSQPKTVPLPATHGFLLHMASGPHGAPSAPTDMRPWEVPLGSPGGQPLPPAPGTLRSLARSALSCTARPCSSGGRRMAVMAFSCRSRSLATLSKLASSWRPCRSEASAGGRSESGGLGGPGVFRGQLSVSPHPPTLLLSLLHGPWISPHPRPPRASGTHLQSSPPSAPHAAAGAPFCSWLPSAAGSGTGCPGCDSKNVLGTPRRSTPPPPTEVGPWVLARQAALRSRAAPQML